MSKSIYEEMIETLLSVGTTFITVPCNPIGLENSDMIHLRNSTVDYESEMSKVIKALLQAQKQEKLLELYIDLANTLEVLDNAYGYEIFEFSEIKYICNKIKELEK